MAEIPLIAVGWVYDEETNRIEVRFQDVARVDDPDPVNFRPSRFFTVEIIPQAVDSEVKVQEVAAPNSIAPMPPESPPAEEEPTEVPTPPVPEPAPEGGA